MIFKKPLASLGICLLYYGAELSYKTSGGHETMLMG